MHGGGDVATLDELVEVLQALDLQEGPARATSVRLPEQVHRAAVLATELGMDASFTSATVHGLLHRIERFVRQQALAGHLAAFPEDQPALHDVVLRRVSGTSHPAREHAELVRTTAALVEERHPGWALEGRIDDAVDRVLEHVELLLEGQDPAGLAV